MAGCHCWAVGSSGGKWGFWWGLEDTTADLVALSEMISIGGLGYLLGALQGHCRRLEGTTWGYFGTLLGVEEAWGTL